MLIIGEGGFAKEVFETISLEENDQIAFFNDITHDRSGLFGKKILHTADEASRFFKTVSPRYTIGIGEPHSRNKMAEKFKGLGGILTSTISSKAIISLGEVTIGDGCNILANALLSNSVIIGTGCIVYYNVTITHDCVVEDFVELSPGATLLGKSKIGCFTQIGANATVLPNKKSALM